MTDTELFLNWNPDDDLLTLHPEDRYRELLSNAGEQAFFASNIPCIE